jgi:hypothetical protein
MARVGSKAVLEPGWSADFPSPFPGGPQTVYRGRMDFLSITPVSQGGE